MIFANSTKTPSDGTLLGRTSRRFLLCWLLFFVIHCCPSFIAVFLMLFFIHCFSTSSLILLWAIAGFLHSFYTFGPAQRRVILDIFILTIPGPSFTDLLRALRYWSGRFLPTGVLTLRFFPTFLTQPAFMKASLGGGSSSLKFAGLHADLETQTQSICLFDSQQSTILIFRKIRF